MRPAINTVPIRWVVTGLAATAMVTVPSPVPDNPALIVSHADWLADVHAQPLVVDTLTEVDCADAPRERLVGDIE